MDTIDALVRALQSFPGGVVIVSHDRRFVHQVAADQIWVCQDSKLARFDGTIDQYALQLVREAEAKAK